MPKSVISTGEELSLPSGFTLSDNRIEDNLQRLLTPTAYVVYRHYLRYWGGDRHCAFPSLSTIAEKSNLSEKTIRKCNRELRDKGFIRYISGGPNHSNRYYYVEVDEIMVKYYNSTTVDKPSNVNYPIKEIDSKSEKKVKEILASIQESFAKRVNSFIKIFLNAYSDKMGVKYKIDYHDAKNVSGHAAIIFENFDLYIRLIETYFKTNNKYVAASDYSLNFMLNDKVKRALVSENNQTNEGRWISDAEQQWKTLVKQLSNNCNIEKVIKENVKFPGASSARDKFVYDYLVNKAEGYLKG